MDDAQKHNLTVNLLLVSIIGAIVIEMGLGALLIFVMIGMR